jgi:hypothetical protein
MIVRIATEGQYELGRDQYETVNGLDNDCVAAVEAGDAERFVQLFAQLLDYVRGEGRQLADDELAESDVVLPPPDTSFEEAAQDFTGEGLIPDSVVEQR